MTRPIVELCVHGEAKPHKFVGRIEQPPHSIIGFACPGGRVLEQAIIIERDTDGWLTSLEEAISDTLCLRMSQLGIPHNRERGPTCNGLAALVMEVVREHFDLDAFASAQENQP